MSAYVVVTGDDKQGVTDPEIWGPFATDAEAKEFVAEVDRDQLRYIQLVGGYYGVHIVSDNTATDPSEWEPIHDEDEDEDEEVV